MSLTQIKLAALLVALAVSFGAGWQVHSWRVDAQANAQTNKGIDKSIEDHKNTIEIVTKRDDKEIKERVIYRTIREKINEVPTDNVCFSPESLSLWNDAIKGADTDRAKSTKETAAVDPVAATEKDILRNAAENFETCRVNSLNHSALIDKVESLKGQMCYCETE